MEELQSGIGFSSFDTKHALLLLLTSSFFFSNLPTYLDAKAGGIC